MPLISPIPQKTKRVSLNIFLDESLLAEVNAYCNWSGVAKPADFILQSVQYVLKNDKDWKKISIAGNQPNAQELKK